MKIRLLVILLFCCVVASAQQKRRPKIGLALSGGGAKGLSHVGVLHVLEKAGIQVDYIAGTSMGSIIGGMYAVGYSADSIEALVRSEDWALLLANSPSLDQIVIEEKSEFGKYIAEMPLVNWRFVLPRGLIDGQELSVELSRVFSVAYHQKDFKKFPIPFRCIATDITNGEPVILESGNVAEAIRASMAIPSIFTPVKYKDRLLVDGGIVRNFPVSDVREMGADIIIGVNLSQGFLKEKDLQSVFDILNQSMFLVDNEDTKRQRDLCHYLIEPHLEGYGAGSFFDTDSLIKRGYDAAMTQFEQLKRLSDSLNKIYGPLPKRDFKLIDSVIIDAFSIEGVKHVDPLLVTGKMALPKNTTLSLNEVSASIGRVYGTRYFSRINYELISKKGGTSMLHLKAVENPNTYLKFAINYNSFSGSALILNFTTRNKFGKRSRLLTTLNIADNFRAKGEYYIYFGPKQNFGLGLGAYYDQNDYPIYQNLVKTGEYTQHYTAFDAKIQLSSLTVNSFGIGVKRELVYMSPQIYSAANTYRGGISQWNFYSYFLLNTQDKVFFPTKGTKTYIEASYIPNSQYDFSYEMPDGQGGSRSAAVPKDSINAVTTPRYIQVKLSSLRVIPIRSNWSFLISGLSGLTINTAQTNNPTNVLFNSFSVGGLIQQYRNQIPFVGVYDYQLSTNNFIGGMTGVQYQFMRNFYITGKFNLGNYVQNFQDYYSTNALISRNNYLSGFGITTAYSSILGPLEFTLMYTPELKSFSSYVNLGFNF